MGSPLDPLGGRLFVAYVLTLVVLPVLAGFDIGGVAGTTIVGLFGAFTAGKAIEKHTAGRVAVSTVAKPQNDGAAADQP